MEKTTKKEQFAKVRAILAEKGETALVEFIDHEVDLLTKKNSARSNKPTKTQVENANLAKKILESMTVGTAYTVSDVQKNCGEVKELSNQKVSALVRSLVAEGKLNRNEVKGKAYFTLAWEKGVNPLSLPIDKK